MRQFESVPPSKARVKAEPAFCVFLVSKMILPCFLLFNVWKLLLPTFVLLYCYWLQECKSDPYCLIMGDLPKNFFLVPFSCANGVQGNSASCSSMEMNLKPGRGHSQKKLSQIYWIKTALKSMFSLDFQLCENINAFIVKLN